MTSIPYTKFPNSSENFPDLFTDYIYFYNKVEKYFNHNFRNQESWDTLCFNLSQRKYNRSELVQVLTEQNRSIHCSVSTLANIDLLYNDNCFAVVTGQQIGLLSGHLYTIYKLITAIKLSESLKISHPSYSFVPVFWCDTEDHDFLEINNLKVIDTQNNISTIEYFINETPQTKFISPTGNLKFDGKIKQFIEQLKGMLVSTEFTPPLFANIDNIFIEGKSFYESFAEFLNHLFHQFGVIFINPNAPKLKHLAKDIFIKELTSASEVSKRVIQTSAELEEIYHVQIKSKPINLFLFHKDGRYSIEPQGDHFFLKNSRQTFTLEEMKNLATNSPELFSPNVVLRPIYQDTILPTITYVAGPAEVAYFAQLKDVYNLFDIPMPIIYPRASITLVEKKISNISEKFNLKLKEMIMNPSEVQNIIKEQDGDVDLDELYSSLSTKIKNSTNEIQFALLQIDPTLEGSVNSFIQKTESLLQVLKEKTLQAKANRDIITQNQYLKLMNNIFPLTSPQERIFNITYYLNKYGPDFINWLYTETNPQLFEHQLIEID